MRIYLLSLVTGVLVGLIYSLLNVRSPAPPLVALVGLLGILIGEQVIPTGRQAVAGIRCAAPGSKRNAPRTSLACCPATTLTQQLQRP
jgi:XapX domain-containing protein